MKTGAAILNPRVMIVAAFTALLALDGAWTLARMRKPAPPRVRGWDYGALAHAPDRARARRNPLENDPDATAAGGKLYRRYCADCHGRSGEGGKRGLNLRSPEVQQAAPGALFWVLTNGVVRRGMPDWSKLPEPERWQIIKYLQTSQSNPVQQPKALP